MQLRIWDFLAKRDLVDGVGAAAPGAPGGPLRREDPDVTSVSATGQPRVQRMVTLSKS